MARRTLITTIVVVASLLITACGDGADDRAPSPTTEGPTSIATGGTSANAQPADDAITVVAVGDIASTPRSGRGTARLTTSLDPDVVLTLGDHAYPDGTLRQFRRKYDPAWGALKPLTRPVPGNHEYRTRKAAGYFRYFADQVGGRRWYAFDAGAWRFYALNCEVRCDAGSRQERWLRRQLDRHGDRPSVVSVHRPYRTCSTAHPPYRGLRAVWRDLQRTGPAIVLGGHAHSYERFAPTRANGARKDSAPRQFVAGTGGAEKHALEPRCRDRESAHTGRPGVLELTLRADGYAWRFVTVDGAVHDEGAVSLPAD